MAKKFERFRRNPLSKVITITTELALRWLRGRSRSGGRRLALLTAAAGLTAFGLLPHDVHGLQADGVPHTGYPSSSPAAVPADGVSYATISFKVLDVDWRRVSGLVEEDFTFFDFGSAVIGGFTEVEWGIYTFRVTNNVVETVDITTEAAGVYLGPFASIVFVDSLAVTTAALPDWTVGIPNYPGALSAAGGTAPYGWWVLEPGDLPTGLWLHGNGAFGGTPSAAGLYDFEVKVTDAYGFTAAKPLSIRIHSPPMIMTAATLPVGVVDVPYGPALIEVTGGAPPLTYDVTDGGLPLGVTLDPVTGQLSGTPTQTGSFEFEVTVTDGSGATAIASFTLVIVDPLRVTTTTLPDWTVHAGNYPGSLSAAGGTEPYTWSVVDPGDLPPGLVVNTNGTFGGTPTVAGTFTFLVMVKDANGITASANLSIQIYPVINAVSDLRLTVEASVAEASLGDEVEVVVKVTNQGAGAANDVVVLEGHIASAEGLLRRITVHRLVRTAVEVDRGTVNPVTGEWLIGRIEANSTVTMTVRLIVVEP